MTASNQQNSAVLTARAEASAWITRLHGPNRTADLEDGFRRWLAERPENAQEFEGLTEIWDLVATGAPARGVPRLERWEQTAEAQELRALRQRLKGRRLAPRFSVAAVLALMVCGALVYRFWPSPSYATTIGEQRVVQLEDGTQVSLNSDTRLSVDYDARGRRIRLEQGEALFQVAKQSDRPFTVIARDNTVTALGTSFLVRLEADRTSITLVEGKVSVVAQEQREARGTQGAGDEANSPQKILLSPGQRLTLAAASAPTMDRPQLDSLTAWRRGEVMLNDTSLTAAVAEMNRYDKTRIVIASPDIGDLVVSGLYHTGDSEGFAQSVVKMYQLKMIRHAGRIELHQK